jgi:hypothetical protein
MAPTGLPLIIENGDRLVGGQHQRRRVADLGRGEHIHAIDRYLLWRGDGADGEDAVARRIAGEFAHIIIGRRRHHVFRRGELHQLPVLHDADAVAEPDRLVEIMGDEDDGLAQQLLQPQELVLHLAADERVERREGFIEKPDIGLDGERAGDADALLLAARQLAREIILAALEPDELDHLARPLLALLTRRTPHLEREGHIGQHAAMRQQTEMLEHHAHLVAAQVDELGRRRLEQIAAVEQDLAPSRIVEAGDGADQRRLAGA